VYAFGVLVFQTLTGRVPFDADTVLKILIAHTTDAPPHPSAVEPAVPRVLDAPILAMLAKDRQRRPPSCGAAVALLEAVTTSAGGALEPASRDRSIALDETVSEAVASAPTIASFADGIAPIDAASHSGSGGDRKAGTLAATAAPVSGDGGDARPTSRGGVRAWVVALGLLAVVAGLAFVRSRGARDAPAAGPLASPSPAATEAPTVASAPPAGSAAVPTPPEGATSPALAPTTTASVPPVPPATTSAPPPSPPWKSPGSQPIPAPTSRPSAVRTDGASPHRDLEY